MPLLQQVRDEVAVLQPPAFSRTAHTFSHIFAGGYAAGYYSYKWAEVLSADAYAAFEETAGNDGVPSIETGRKYRQAILEAGGSRPAMESFKAFRGREPHARRAAAPPGHGLTTSDLTIWSAPRCYLAPRLRRRHGLTACSLACARRGAALAQQVYRIVGPDGKVTFSDQPPPAERNGRRAAAPAARCRQRGSGRPALRTAPGGAAATRSRCTPAPTARPATPAARLLASRGMPFTERTVTTQRGHRGAAAPERRRPRCRC